MATEVTKQNNNEYISYSYEGAGYKIKVPAYNSDTKILCQVTIKGTIPTVIADAGTSITCVQTAAEQLQVSECGQYRWVGAPFEKSAKNDQIFFDGTW